MSREQSSIGSSIYYGARDTDKKVGQAIGMSTGVEYLEVEYNYDDLPAADANDAAISAIPAGSTIISGFVEVTTAVTGATAYDIGLQESDGTEIDNDGLTDGSTNLTAGSYALDGALIGSKITEAGQLVASFTGTATAGAFRVRIVYTK